MIKGETLQYGKDLITYVKNIMFDRAVFSKIQETKSLNIIASNLEILSIGKKISPEELSSTSLKKLLSSTAIQTCFQTIRNK